MSADAAAGLRSPRDGRRLRHRPERQLLAEERYFAELAEVNPLMNALNVWARLLGNDYEKNVRSESGHYPHLRATRLASGDGLLGSK